MAIRSMFTRTKSALDLFKQKLIRLAMATR